MQTKLFQFETYSSSLVKKTLAIGALIALCLLAHVAQAQQCRSLFSPPQIWNRKNLRVITFNAQDFTLYEKKESRLPRPEAKDEKLARLAAKTLFEKDPDIIVLQEVGSKYSLKKFAEFSRDQDYDAILIEGHDTVAVDSERPSHHARHIAFLIKKSLNLKYNITSNLNIPYTGTEQPQRKFLFDRGLPVIKFFDTDPQNPLFAVIGVHNHSLGSQNKFIELKSLEEQAMVQVVKDLENLYGQNFPTILMGDLNTNISDRGKLDQLKSFMIESFDDLKIGLLDRVRTTHIYEKISQIIAGRRAETVLVARQVDAVMVNQSLSGRILKSSTLGFSVKGVSDHRPLMVDILLEGKVPPEKGPGTF